MFAGLPVDHTAQAVPWRATVTEADMYGLALTSSERLDDLLCEDHLSCDETGSGSLTPDQHPRFRSFRFPLKNTPDKGFPLTKMASDGLTDGAQTPVWTGSVNGGMTSYETAYLNHALGQAEREINERLSSRLDEPFRCEPPDVPPPPEPPLATELFMSRRNSRKSEASMSEGLLMSRTSSMHTESVISVGTVGHPHCCAEPCRYVKRKSGCREGLRCPNCHKCSWRRGFQKTAPSQQSLTLGASPEGEVSTHIDLPLDQPAYVRHAGLDAGARPAEGGGLSEFVMSAGSVGHPTRCAAPCKYNSKSKGCKDGSLCTHCHLCHWQRCKGSRGASGLTSGRFGSTSDDLAPPGGA